LRGPTSPTRLTRPPPTPSPRWSRLYDDDPAYQLVLWDDATGEVLGEANTIPCRCDGTLQGLPHGIDEVIATGLPDVGTPPAPTALCALAIAIPSGQENKGAEPVAVGLYHEPNVWVAHQAQPARGRG
jgi:hypothetical protein